MLNNINFLLASVYSTLYGKYFLFFKSYFYLRNIARKWLMHVSLSNYYLEFTIQSIFVENFIFFLQNFTGTQVTQLLDITAVDFLSMISGRYVVYYWLLSPIFNTRYLIQCPVTTTNIMPTMIFLYNSANWLEREIWDFFGIYFQGHNDLRRILTDYGFIGYPLRKDYPLSGYSELYYNDILKSVVYYKNNFAQEFRYYNFLIPWRKL